MKKKVFLSFILLSALGFGTTVVLSDKFVSAQNRNVSTSSDAKAEYDVVSKTLTLSTNKVKREIKFLDGKFVTTSLVDLVSNTSYVQNGSYQNEFSFTVNDSLMSSSSRKRKNAPSNWF